MANEDIGKFHCKNCDEIGAIRKAKSGRQKLYVMCGCGQNFMNTAKGQDIILERGTFYGAEKKPVNVTEKRAPEPEQKPVTLTESIEQEIITIESDQPVTEKQEPEPVTETKTGGLTLFD